MCLVSPKQFDDVKTDTKLETIFRTFNENKTKAAKMSTASDLLQQIKNFTNFDVSASTNILNTTETSTISTQESESEFSSAPETSDDEVEQTQNGKRKIPIGIINNNPKKKKKC